MKLWKGIQMQPKEARLVYLSCLTCVVLFVGVFSYNLWLHFDIHPPSLFGDPAEAQTDPNGSSNGADSPVQDGEVDLGGLKYTIILPTYKQDMQLAVEFLQSFMCLCTDYREIDIRVIVSDSSEVDLFNTALDGLKACGETFSIFRVPPGNVNGPRPNIKVVNFFDIVPPVFHSLTSGAITAGDTSALLRERGKYQYQTIKKLAAAAAFDYDWALWLDSESIAVQPFSARQTFGAYVRAPTVWTSRLTNHDMMRATMRGSASVLNRTTESFGQNFWNLESQEWLLEKAVLDDLVRYVERVHGQEFWRVWATHGGPFEITLYNMHVESRKLETADPMFTKYRILETEREMEKYGVLTERTRPIKDKMLNTGLLERSSRFLQVPEVAPRLSQMLRDYSLQLFRLDKVEVAAPEVIDRFLLDTPINLLCSGVPPLHSWWKERNVTIG